MAYVICAGLLLLGYVASVWIQLSLRDFVIWGRPLSVGRCALRAIPGGLGMGAYFIGVYLLLTWLTKTPSSAR